MTTTIDVIQIMELTNLKDDGIKIIKEYTATRKGNLLYICHCLYDGVLIKYITFTKWDYKMKVLHNVCEKRTMYINSNNEEMFVWEHDDDEYYEI